MADLDAELLALAGGDDSSDEEQLEQPTKPTEAVNKAESPTPSADDSDLAVAASSSAKPGVTPKKITNTNSKATTKKTMKKGKKDESEEEGEA